MAGHQFACRVVASPQALIIARGLFCVVIYQCFSLLFVICRILRMYAFSITYRCLQPFCILLLRRL